MALFFGLSGTGKTTLSSDPARPLIGDDEHGWGENGIFNFEGGCYAKVIDLSRKAEPVIWDATHRFGTVLENVAADAAGNLDLTDGRATPNTRACYPIDFVANASKTGRGGQPKHVVMLTCDAFGVLPPIAKLSPGRRCTTSCPATPPASPAPRRAWAASRRRRSPPASARRSCRAGRKCTARCWPS